MSGTEKDLLSEVAQYLTIQEIILEPVAVQTEIECHIV